MEACMDYGGGGMMMADTILIGTLASRGQLEL